jgi:transposase InsO family protein
MKNKDYEIKTETKKSQNEDDDVDTEPSASSTGAVDGDKSDSANDFAEDINFGAFSTIGTDAYCFDCPINIPAEIPSYLKAQRRIRRKLAHSSVTAGGDDYVPEDALLEVPSSAAFVARSASKLHDPNIAIIDSGANKHLLRELKMLRKIREANIMMESSNGSNTRIDKIGDFHLRTKDEDGNEMDPLVLSDASILKGSPLNLVSVGMLCEKGSTFHFEKGNSYFVYCGKRFKMEEYNGLFLIRLDRILQADELDDLKTAQPACDPEDMLSRDGTAYGCAATYDLWHQRFGHASKKRIKFLYKTGAVEGLEVNKGAFKHDNKCRCPTCVQVNNEKVHIGDVRKYADDVTQVGQKVVCDLCGPFPASIEGFRYVISFTDTYSRFSACYFLKKKSDAEEALESFIRFFKNEGFVIKVIRSDQGGEFGGHNERQSDEGGTVRRSKIPVFDRLCHLHGIKHELTPANRPELHGLAERWNKTVVRMANAMLFGARLSHVLWPSAVAHANMLRNRLPLRGLGDYTPYTIFYHRRPRVDQLRVFGCDCYKLLPNYPKIPGQMSRKRLIFVGFTPDRIGFRCFDPIEFKFTTEWELEFDEASTQKRANSLREYDDRRRLNEKGQLDDLPCIQDADFDLLNEAYDNERRLFASPPLTPNVNSGSQGGGISGEDNVAMQKSPKVAAEVDDDDTTAAKDETYEETHQAKSSEKTAADCNGETKKRCSSRSSSDGTRTESTPKTEVIDENIRSSQSRNPMKDSPPSGSQRGKLKTNPDESPENESVGQHSSSTSPTPSTEIGDKYTLDGMRIEGPWERSTRSLAPTSDDEVKAGADADVDVHNDQKNEHRGSRSVLRDRNDELKNVEDLLINTDADRFGPLSKSELEKERSISKVDPSLSCRPLRIEPIGVVVKDSEASKLFRKAALENDYVIKLVDNPKTKGSDSWKRYQKYQPATTLRELIELSATSRDPARRKQQVAKAKADIINDYLRGFIMFPECENRSSAHFVSASFIAKACETLI